MKVDTELKQAAEFLLCSGGGSPEGDRVDADVVVLDGDDGVERTDVVLVSDEDGEADDTEHIGTDVVLAIDEEDVAWVEVQDRGVV